LIEAELKVHDPDTLRVRLRRLASEEISLYRDTYYDKPSLLPEPVHPWTARTHAGGALEGGLRRNHARGGGEQ